MTERPQDYTDEELERVLADDEMWGYYELMLCAEQGFACRREQRRNRGLMIRRIAAMVLVVLIFVIGCNTRLVETCASTLDV